MTGAASPHRWRLGGLRLAGVAEAILAGLAMGVLAYLSIEATRASGRVAAMWPANAVILAALLAKSHRVWPWFLAAALAADFGANLLVGDTLPLAGGLAACNVLEIALCAAALRRLVGARLDLSSTPHLVAFATVALLASMVSALAAASLRKLAAQHDFVETLAIWTMGDALGLVIVTPALLALNRRSLGEFLAVPVAARNLGLLAGLAAITVYVVMQPHLEARSLILGALIVVAFKGEVAGAALGLLVSGGLIVVLSALGLEPAIGAAGEGRTQAFLIQIFLLASAAIAFPVAGAVARRRELAAALEATARDYELLANHSTDFILRIRPDGRIAYASPSCRQVGYEPGELMGRSIVEFTHPEERERSRAQFLQILAGGPGFEGRSFERRLKTAAGDWIWTEGTPQIIYGRDGKADGVVSHLRDITARRAAQTALAESEARYRLLADRVSDIIVQIDADATIAYVSPAARRLGWEPGDMVGRRALDFIHPEDRSTPAERLAMLLAGTDVDQFEGNQFRLRRPDGSYVWVDANTSVLRNESRTILGAVAVLRDITERRAFEDELKHKRAEAETASIAKSEFLANMSHEVRTPLTGIMGFAGLLEDVAALPDEAKTYASRITTASRALLSVVNDILDFSKIEAGQVELHPQPFDPAAFVAETVGLVSAQAGEKRLALVTRVDGDLPKAVLADSGRLRQVLLNLIGNAVKFTDEGGVTVSIRHSAEGGGRLSIMVADTGVGIAPDVSHRLFQRFSQADGSINRQYGGTGLGLAICKSLTALMGGEIGVESQPGEGSRFWFTVAAPACEPAAAAPEADDSGFETPPARILVVDDSPVNRELVGVLLSVFGHELTEAAGGAEAVQLANAAPFDLILMDLQMPGMDGLAAAREIRAGSPHNRQTPIIALSANMLPMHLAACQDAGMNDHIGKPIDTRELLTKVARWTGEHVEEVRARSA